MAATTAQESETGTNLRPVLVTFPKDNTLVGESPISNTEESFPPAVLSLFL